MRLYCNDCGRAFEATGDMVDFYSRCMDCVHEAGDCVGQDRKCDPCQVRHNARHIGTYLIPADARERIYCQACHPDKAGLVPFFGGEG